MAKNASKRPKKFIGGAGGGAGRLQKAGLPVKAPRKSAKSAPVRDVDKDNDAGNDFDNDGM